MTTDTRITRVFWNFKKLIVHSLRPFPRDDTTIFDTFFAKQVLSPNKHQRMAVLPLFFPTKPQDKLLHIQPVCTLPYRSFDSQVHSWRHTSRLQRISSGLVGLTILWGLWLPCFIVKGSLTRICILALQKPTRTKAKVRTKISKRLLQLCFSRKVHSFASDQRRTLL